MVASVGGVGRVREGLSYLLLSVVSVLILGFAGLYGTPFKRSGRHPATATLCDG